MALQKSGPLLYVNMRDKNQIGVIERRSRSVGATWELQKVAHNTPLALDETDHRLFVAGRKPGTFGVMDTSSGKEVASLPAAASAWIATAALDPTARHPPLAGGAGSAAAPHTPHGRQPRRRR